MKITILGRPASKKNARRNFVHKYTHRMISIPSEAYENFKSMAIPQLKPLTYERDFHPFDRPIRVDYVFYRKGKLRQDFDNAIASINDVLQDAGIIVDDKLIQEGSFQCKSGCSDWKTELEINIVQ